MFPKLYLEIMRYRYLMNTRLLILAMSTILISACARHQVIIDPAGVDQAQYQQDLAECTQVAEQVNQKAGEGAATGAVIYGAIGAILGDRNDAKRLAGVGAVSGGASGAQQTKQEKTMVLKNCMRNRGYRVLN
jgi:uncharacterized protein YcfJ